jgi:hypothetical protein
MYRNVFRKVANGLECCKKTDILEKKAANKAAKNVDTDAVARLYETSTMDKAKKIRGATESTVVVS